MNILMTTDTVGGIWTYAITLARALERHATEVTLATMGTPLSAEQRQEVRACRNVRLFESTFRLEWMPDPWPDVAAAGDWLLDLERQVRPDVVHLNGYAHGSLPWSAPVLMVGHSCVLSWWRAVHGTDAPPEWDRYRAMVRAGLHATDLVAAPTRAMLTALIEHYGITGPTAVLPNGCDGEVLPLGVRDAFGRYPGRPLRHEPVILAAGRVWDESKNLGTLAAAAPRISWPVHIAGSDRHPSGRRHALPGVHSLGLLAPATLRQWYRRASIFVQPSVYEPFGLTPLEAALERTALVLGDIPSLREVWGDAAVFVPPMDAAALADAINELAGNPQLLTARMAAACRRARSMSARRMGDSYRAAYTALRATARPAQVEAVPCAS